MLIAHGFKYVNRMLLMYWHLCYYFCTIFLGIIIFVGSKLIGNNHKFAGPSGCAV